MKTYLFILALLCLGFIHSSGEGCYQISEENLSKETCNNALNEYEKKEGYEKCCYIKCKIGGNENKYCERFTKYQFEHLNFKDVKYQCGSDDGFNIECDSNYFKLSLLSLIFLFF